MIPTRFAGWQFISAHAPRTRWWRSSSAVWFPLIVGLIARAWALILAPRTLQTCGSVTIDRWFGSR
jgi:hypothetical protein